MMMRLPFRQQLDSGELGGGNRGTYVEDAFAFEPGGGKMSLAELERRQAERERVWFERGERVRNFLQNTWANTESWVSPVLTGLERSGAAVAAPFVAIREMQRAPRNAAGGIEDWSEVRKVFTDVMEDPGNVNLGRVFPGALGLAADVLAPGPDLGHAARVIGPVLDGLSSLLTKFEPAAPGLSAFLLPLRESFAKGSSSDRVARIVDEAAGRFLDPNVADRFRAEFRDLAMMHAESYSEALYPVYDGFDDMARDNVINDRLFDVFDTRVTGMDEMIDALENMNPSLNLWASDPDLAVDILRVPNDPMVIPTLSTGRTSLDALVEQASDYKMAKRFDSENVDLNVTGTDATRTYDVRTDVTVQDAVDALGRYTSEKAASSMPFTSRTQDFIQTNLGGNLYNAVNTYLRGVDKVRAPAGHADVDYESFWNLFASNPDYFSDMLQQRLGNSHALSWVRHPSDFKVINDEIALLDTAFSMASLPSDTTVYRGGFMSPSNPFGISISDLTTQARSDPNFSWDAAADALIGTVVRDRGFTSFTERPEHAFSFVRPKLYATDSGEERFGVFYQMRLPKGSQALPLYGELGSAGAFAGEQEILMPRNIPMRVVDAQFRFPTDVGQSGGFELYPLDTMGRLKPYLVVLVEPDFSAPR